GDVVLPKDIEADSRVYGFSTVAAAQKGVSARAVQQFEAAARDVAHQVFSVEAKRAALVGCTPASIGDECSTGFLRRFGRRAFRRALDSAELDRVMSVAKTTAQAF